MAQALSHVVPVKKKSVFIVTFTQSAFISQTPPVLCLFVTEVFHFQFLLNSKATGKKKKKKRMLDLEKNLFISFTTQKRLPAYTVY